MKSETVYGICKGASDSNPIMMLTKDEYESILKVFEFTERVYSTETDTISVRDESSGYMTELTIRHLIRVY